MLGRKHSHMSSNMTKNAPGTGSVMAAACVASKYLCVKWQRWRKWSLTPFWFWKHRADRPCSNDYRRSVKDPVQRWGMYMTEEFASTEGSLTRLCIPLNKYIFVISSYFNVKNWNKHRMLTLIYLTQQHTLTLIRSEQEFFSNVQCHRRLTLLCSSCTYPSASKIRLDWLDDMKIIQPTLHVCVRTILFLYFSFDDSLELQRPVSRKQTTAPSDVLPGPHFFVKSPRARAHGWEGGVL